MEKKLLNDLAANGCSVAQALNDTFLGNEDFYVRVFGRLSSNTALARLEQSLASNDVKGVFEAAHELKGMYGNLGLTPLYGCVCIIVETARAGSLNGIAERLPELKELHARIVALGRNGLVGAAD